MEPFRAAGSQQRRSWLVSSWVSCCLGAVTYLTESHRPPHGISACATTASRFPADTIRSRPRHHSPTATQRQLPAQSTSRTFPCFPRPSSRAIGDSRGACEGAVSRWMGSHSFRAESGSPTRREYVERSVFSLRKLPAKEPESPRPRLRGQCGNRCGGYRPGRIGLSRQPSSPDGPA